MEPSRTAALEARSQTSRAISGVRRVSAGRSIRCSVCWIRSSGTTLRKGDCSSCTSNPWRSVPSNTGSPVLLMKSASTSVSLSDSVKHGVARFVDEIGEHQRIFVRELWCAVRIEITGGEERQPDRGGRNDRLPAFGDARCGALQALEVGANLGCVLVAQLAIFFQAPADDAL